MPAATADIRRAVDVLYPPPIAAVGSHRLPLGRLLIEHGLITTEQLEQVLKVAAQSGEKLGKTAVSLGYVNRLALSRVIAEQAGLPHVNLREDRPAVEIARLLPLDVARRLQASLGEIHAAPRVANVDEFIQMMPDGYASIVSERGTTLSGGQTQRIAIARAVLRAAPILILDEPTSGLDAASDRLVMRALERAAVGRTTLIIAHRLTTVRSADRIIVLEKGQLVEMRAHTELLKRGGRYAEFYNFAFQ